MNRAARRTATAIASVAAATVLLGTSMLPAEAIRVLPSTAPLTDTAGAANGCTAEAPPMRKKGNEANKRLTITLDISCPAAADVHWASYTAGLFEVMPDGTLRTQYANGLIARIQDGNPITDAGGAGWEASCKDPAFAGTHQWLLRATLKTKHANKDTHPYSAKVNRLQTVTCP